MSLLDEYMEPCVLMTQASSLDGYGGTKTTWTDGESFSAAIVPEGSSNDRTANVGVLKNSFTVTTSRAVELKFHDVFRRTSDNAVFRVTSNEKKTPGSAGLDMRQVSAEEWRVPT